MSATVLKTIHAAAREMGLEREDRVSLQLAVTGKESLAEMSDAERRAVLEALRARGWKPRTPRRRPAAPRADLRYLHVLWRLLAEREVVRPGAAELNGFVRARFGRAWGAVPIDVDRLTDHARIRDVTQALKAMCVRNGIDPEGGRG